MAFLDNTGVTRLVTDLKARFAAITHNHAASDITSGTLPIARGGTGATTHTSNAVLTGNGTSAVNNVATADGALYATAANGAAQFGTLPIAQGGTGAITAAGAVENVVDGQALKPASVAATGEVSAKSGTTTHKLTEKAEDTRADNLEASIAPVESVTATANHAVGDYFMLGDVLMKATSAIATGETITTSNATPATVQSQIDALRDSVDTANLLSITRVSTTVTTGSTGNIALPYTNDGKTFIVGPHTNGGNYCCFRIWVNDVGTWFLTAIDPNTGATKNNSSVDLRYFVVKLMRM